MFNPTFPTTYLDDDTLGGRISLARDAADLSVEETAAIVGVEPQTWSNWENDRSAPRANRLDMLARVLQVNLGWLLSGKGTGPNYRSDFAPGA